jgi:hypothetical protein
MDDFNEKRFGYLRVLTDEEKQTMIDELESDVVALQSIIDDKNTSGEQRSELYSDIANETAQIAYLKSILGEKTL